MIKNWQSMHEYRLSLINTKAKFDSSERIRLHNELSCFKQKLLLFDTDKAMEILLPFYSSTGRPATNQPQILRSFILFFLMFSSGLTPGSLTLWVNRLSSDRVLASLIGCTTDSLPPIGSYYDLMDRLWAAPESDLYSRTKALPASHNSKKPDKPKGKGQKAQERHPEITKKLVKRITDGKDIPFHFEERLQRLFYHVAVLPSMEAGVIPSEHLTASGDGTCVHTHANPKGHHVGRRDSSISDETWAAAPRHYADPDASWGWDSDIDKYYYGFTLFHISCHNSELHSDIPLLLRFTSARRHDSVNFLASFHEMQTFMPDLQPENMCLDSAMDNYPTYELLKARNIRAFIDLNANRGRPKTIPDEIKIDKDGTPICRAGLRMVPNGSDKAHGNLIWRCPYGKNHADKCKCCCSPSSTYGHVVKTKAEWDIRFYTEVPRGTEAYKKIYNQRTATERINNKILNDYGLHRMKIHTRKHYSFLTTMIGICLHLDARYKQIQLKAAA